MFEAFRFILIRVNYLGNVKMLYALSNESEKCAQHLVLIGCLPHPVEIRHLLFHP